MCCSMQKKFVGNCLYNTKEKIFIPANFCMRVIDWFYRRRPLEQINHYLIEFLLLCVYKKFMNNDKK